MKTIRLLLLFATLILMISLISPVKGQVSGFVISGADATSTLNTISSAPLTALFEQSSPRFVLEYADISQYNLLEIIPTRLDALLEMIETRYILEFADANDFLSLTDTPAGFDALLNNLKPRIIFEFANANRQLAYGYPKELIGDSVPPLIKDIRILPGGDSNTEINWVTDELSNSKVECGTKIGEYYLTNADLLYVTEHAIKIYRLSPGTRYFCLIYSTDMSDNSAKSTEVKFVQPGTPFSLTQVHKK